MNWYEAAVETVFFMCTVLSGIFLVDLFGLGTFLVKNLRFPIFGIILINIIAGIAFILVLGIIFIGPDKHCRAGRVPGANPGRCIRNLIGKNEHGCHDVSCGSMHRPKIRGIRLLFFAFLSGLALSAVFLFNPLGSGSILADMGFPILGIILINILTVLTLAALIILMVSSHYCFSSNKSHKCNPIFIALGIDGSGEEDRKHRRDFWIVLMILCLAFVPTTFSKMQNYTSKDNLIDKFPPKMLVVSPTVDVVDTLDECEALFASDNDTICVLRQNLNDRQAMLFANIDALYRLDHLFNMSQGPSVEDDIYNPQEDMLNDIHDRYGSAMVVFVRTRIVTESSYDGSRYRINISLNNTGCESFLFDLLNQSGLVEQSQSSVSSNNSRLYDDILKDNFVKVDVLDDPDFEQGTWFDEAGDCCYALDGESDVWLEHSRDVTSGKYALKLMSRNHCACVSQPFKNFSNEVLYFMTLDYKGSNPKYCLWTMNDSTCLPSKPLESSEVWKKDYQVLEFTNNSFSTNLHLYSDSYDGVLNEAYYDNIMVYESKLHNSSAINEMIRSRASELMQAEYRSRAEVVCGGFFSQKRYLFVALKNNMRLEGKEALDATAFDDMQLYIIPGDSMITASHRLSPLYYVYLVTVVVLLVTSVLSLCKIRRWNHD